ncbi:hypothetical protein SK128_005616 [Halocaridina rubra]|uniref:Chitin-binding type-2 domain-containing protein n=1 Tax=Halocaridina rubra TaxID=373956 RepID=A0AAN8XHQ2_HALRR
MADRRLLLMGLFLAVTYTAVSQRFDCVPICDTLPNFTKVADPFNCTNYYICLGNEPSPEPIPCDEGYYFEVFDCIEIVTSCQPICAPGKTCSLTCDAGTPGDFINDPFNCSIYYECLVGGLVTNECPRNLPYYDISISNCVTDAEQCCKPSCEPNCEMANTVIPDPKDCSYYYLCLEEGTPSEDYRMSCSEGEVYDLPLGRCTTTGICQILCP